jgi:sigma-B regulation protein RsbU (phosphoserine phosphatase)
MRRALAPVAAAWLQEAAGFGIWHDDRALAYWPESAAAQAPPSPDLHARAGDGVSGDGAAGDGLMLGLVGLVDAAGSRAQERLDADAALLALLVRHEREIEQLADELVLRQDQLLAIFELSRLIRHASDLPATLRTLTARTRELLNASHAFVRLEQPDVAPLSFVEPAPSVFIDDTFARGWLDRVRDTTQDCVVSESLDTTRRPHILAAPVHARSLVSAVLGVTRDNRRFQTPDLKMMQAIAEQAGVLIENALVQRERVAEAALHAEMQLAARVHRDLLSRSFPSRRGLDLFAVTRPASQIGGDFYDFIPLGDDGLFVCLGDVSGKGVPAAIVMAMTRSVLRYAVRTSPPEPHWLLRAAAGSLYDDLTALQMFATAFLGMFDARTRELRYINAGHGPVIHRTATGTSTLLTADEPPLGMLATTQTTRDHRLRLEAGDLLVIASDGINESRAPDDQQFGYLRVTESIERAADRGAAEIAQALLDDVERFRRGRPAGDDQTIVVLKGR